jgi:hypothetical protein
MLYWFYPPAPKGYTFDHPTFHPLNLEPLARW